MKSKPRIRAKLLLVEDDEALRMLAKMTLEGGGFRVFDAGSWSEGRELFRTQKIDLVIMDLDLPEIQGDEAMQEMRALEDPTQGRTPLIFFSGKSPEHLRKAQERTMAAAIVPKGSGAQALRTTVEAVLEAFGVGAET